MINIEDLQKALDLIPLSAEVKSAIMDNSQILVEFRHFMAEKYSISEKDAEEKIKQEISGLYDLQNEPSIEEISILVESYSKDEGFQKHEELKTSIVNLQNSLRSF
jgi:hypothetical protein